MMTVQLLKSLLPDGFTEKVEAHRKALLAHRFTEGVPAPTADHVIEACVRRVPVDGQPDDYVADYCVEDDTPPPPTLDEKKAALHQRLSLLEQEAMAEADPPLKRRVNGLRIADIMATDEERRTAADKRFLVEHNERIRRRDAIHRHFAEQEAAIHDLTDQTVMDWQLAPFKP